MRKIVSLFLAVIVSVITVLPVFAETSSSSSLDIADWAMIAAEAGYEVIDTQAELLDNYCDDLYLLYLGACKNGKIAEALVAAWLRTGAFSFETSTSGLPVMKGILEAGELVKSKIDDESFSPFYLEYLDGTVDESVTSDDVANVSGEVFNDVIKRLNEQYGPKANPDTVIISWKDDPYWSNTASNPRGGYLTVFEGANLWCGQGWYDVYMVPFYYDGTDYYYSEFQYYYYMSEPVQDSSGANVIMVNCDTLSYLDGETATFTDLYDRATGNYFDFCLPGFLSTGNQYIGVYPSIAAIGAGKATSTPSFNVSIAHQFYNADFEAIDKPYTQGTALGFNLPPTSYDTDENIGFICSSEPISIDYDFDEFPTNYYITVGGDNIYNYTITDPGTGESSTINYYITNNYSFPEGDDDGGESGGTTSGDVNVGGNVNVSGDIDVGGKVDINVDVNINDNASSGTSESDPSYVDGVNTDLVTYLEKTPDISNGFIGYLQAFFDWLPADVIALMVLGLTVAVWCRLAGR